MHAISQVQPESQAERLPSHVLIIDDDKPLADVLAQRLQHQGYETTTAHTGMLGLALARREHPDLVILDMRLPDTTGLALCEKLAASPATWDIPVLFLTAMEGPRIVRQTRSAGGRFYLRKPYDPDTLLLLVESAVGTPRV